jgi:hypothetical protein
VSLLRWLVQNATTPQALQGWGSPHTKDLRERLVNREPESIAKALEALNGERGDAAWYVLEGPSCPDVFISTDDAVVVIEGKRTEPSPTTATTWMPIRHQMLRHLDAAWDLRGDRQLFGFFIVEESATARWTQAATQTIGAEALEASLPHRSADERKRIAECSSV